jgi:GTP pyrophosphokinase
VQIRTEAMDQIAEHGRCAHWAYKRGAFQQEEGQYQWLKDILEIFGTNTSPQERLSNARREIITGEMFCFTPQGDIVSLPEGATAVDFAYAVHTNIGNSCIGARVDGRVMPLWTVLQSGENVEILTGPGQQPSALWEQFIITGKARSCIRKSILTREKVEFALLGRSLLQQQLALLDPDISQKDLLQKLTKAFGCTTLKDLQLAIGHGLIPYPSLLRKVLPFTSQTRSSVPVSPIRLSDFTVGIAVHYAECCHPIENSPVVGELVPGQGLVIHTHPCIQERHALPALIAVVWGKNALPADTCLHLHLIILNKLGSFATVFDILRDLKIRVTHVKIDYRDIKLIHVTAEIHTEEEMQLAQALASLRACHCVQKVEEKR